MNIIANSTGEIGSINSHTYSRLSTATKDNPANILGYDAVSGNIVAAKCINHNQGATVQTEVITHENNFRELANTFNEVYENNTTSKLKDTTILSIRDEGLNKIQKIAGSTSRAKKIYDTLSSFDRIEGGGIVASVQPGGLNQQVPMLGVVSDVIEQKVARPDILTNGLVNVKSSPLSMSPIVIQRIKSIDKNLERISEFGASSSPKRQFIDVDFANAKLDLKFRHISLGIKLNSFVAQALDSAAGLMQVQSTPYYQSMIETLAEHVASSQNDVLFRGVNGGFGTLLQPVGHSATADTIEGYPEVSVGLYKRLSQITDYAVVSAIAQKMKAKIAYKLQLAGYRSSEEYALYCDTFEKIDLDTPYQFTTGGAGTILSKSITQIFAEQGIEIIGSSSLSSSFLKAQSNLTLPVSNMFVVPKGNTPLTMLQAPTFFNPYQLGSDLIMEADAFQTQIYLTHIGYLRIETELVPQIA